MSNRLTKLTNENTRLRVLLEESRERTRLSLERAMAYYQNGPRIGSVSMLHDGQLYLLQIQKASLVNGTVRLLVASPFPSRP